MFDVLETVTERLGVAGTGGLLRAASLLLLGVPLVYLVGGWLRRLAGSVVSPQSSMIVGKLVRYSGLLVILLASLHELGFSLTPLLGAAGVIGLAVGFASQTSVSNVISGVFLIVEQPFEVGDVITVADSTGEVLSIDLLSIKIRTADNRMVRIPNETILKTTLTNVTRFGLRRLDVRLVVAPDEDVTRVRELLLAAAQLDPLCLREPEPSVVFSGFLAEGIELILAAWVARDDFGRLKNSLQEEIKRRLDAAGVRLAQSQRVVHGARAAPLEVRLLAAEPLAMGDPAPDDDGQSAP